MTPSLTLHLLGGVSLSANEAPLAAPKSRKGLALFLYLACTGRTHTQEALADLLWDATSTSQSLSNLRTVLSRLSPDLSVHLLITRDTLAINPASQLVIDAATLSAALRAVTYPLTDQSAAHLTKVLAGYPGEFLADFDVVDAPRFHAWMTTERTRLFDLVVEGYQQLTAYLLQRGQYQAGISIAAQLLALDPLDETGHRQLMRLLVYTGQRAAALTQYDLYRQLLAAELGVEPDESLQALYTQIRNNEITAPSVAAQAPVAGAAFLSVDKTGEPSRGQPAKLHGLLPEIPVFYGRQAEVAQLQEWLLADSSHLVAVVGMGGMGKSALIAHLIPQLHQQFDLVFWHSLLNAPPCEEVLRSWVHVLSDYHQTRWPDHLGAQFALFYQLLTHKRCLFVLDNCESIMATAGNASGYRPGYEAYGQLFQRIGESQHRSCLLLTSRELPQEVQRLTQTLARVHVLRLQGLTGNAGHVLLRRHGMAAVTAAQTDALVLRYSGNPLALQLAAETIREFFAGDVATFLAEQPFLFTDIRLVLDQQFTRLTPLEHDILIWLAIHREAVSLSTLRQSLLPPIATSTLIETLQALQRRSLLEDHSAHFTLQHVIMEYVTAYLVDKVGQEIVQMTPTLLHSHALLFTKAKEYVRQSQVRLILQPILQKIIDLLGKAQAEHQLQQLLARLRTTPVDSYAGGNVLNLLVQGECEIGQYDFSQVTLRHAYLSKANLQGVNFARTHWQDAVFINPFSACEAIAFSPDGGQLAGGTKMGELYFWQANEGRPTAFVKAHATTIWDIAFSPDGQLLASASKDQTVRLWEVQSGRCRQVLAGHQDWVRAVAFHPAGHLIASGGHDRTVRVWDIASGMVVHMLTQQTGWVMGLAFSPDGATLASTGTDQVVRLWDVRTGEERAVLRGHTASVEPVQFSPDGALLVTGSEDRTLRVWDLSSLTCRSILTGAQGAIYVLAFHTDGRRLFSAGHEPLIRCWDIATERLLDALPGHRREVNALALSPNGVLLASSETDNSTVHLWEIAPSLRLRQVLHGYRSWMNGIAFCAGRPAITPAHLETAPPNCEKPLPWQGVEWVAGAGSDGRTYLWDFATEQVIQTLRGKSNNGNLAVAVGRQPGTREPLLAVGGTDGTVSVWSVHPQPADATTVTLLHTHSTPDEVHTVAFTPDGQQLLAGTYGGVVYRWATQNGALLTSYHLPGDPRIKRVVISPDGQWIAGGSHNKTIPLWEVATGRCRHLLQGHQAWVWGVAFHPTGQILASGSFDQSVRFWDVERGELLQTLPHEPSLVQAFAFSPDGGLLAVATGDALIYLWDTTPLAQVPTTPPRFLQKLTGHFNTIQDVAFSADGAWLASSSLDGTTNLWAVAQGRCVQTWHAPGPYAGMNISGVTGLTSIQRQTLLSLGAVERP